MQRLLLTPLGAAGLVERLGRRIHSWIAAIPGHLRERALDRIERRLPPTDAAFRQLQRDVLRIKARRLP